MTLPKFFNQTFKNFSEASSWMEKRFLPLEEESDEFEIVLAQISVVVATAPITPELHEAFDLYELNSKRSALAKVMYQNDIPAEGLVELRALIGKHFPGHRAILDTRPDETLGLTVTIPIVTSADTEERESELFSESMRRDDALLHEKVRHSRFHELFTRIVVTHTYL